MLVMGPVEIWCNPSKGTSFAMLFASMGTVVRGHAVVEIQMR